jgi:SOS-response transcriptional repressor LexA
MSSLAAIAALIKFHRVRLMLSQDALAEKVGVSRGAVSAWERGANGPNRRQAPKLAKIFGVEEHDLLPLSGAGIDFLDSTIESFRVPIFPMDELPMGADDAQAKRTDGEGSLHIDQSYSRRCFVVRITDDSMAPEYHPGDLAVVDPDLRPLTDDDVVVRIANSPAILRRYVARGLDRRGHGVFDLVSANTDHATLSVNADVKATIIGVVIEHRRKRRQRL